MKVILTEDHDTLGAKGDAVEVKNGYGQNFLIPRRLAVPATTSALKRYAEETRQAAHKVEAAKAGLQALAARLDGTTVTISTRTGEGGRLFGTITTQQVVEALAAAGTEVDRRKVSLEGDIRETGDYPATVRLGADAVATVTVRVVSDSGPAASAGAVSEDSTSDEVSSYEDGSDDDD
ncbi:MAG TPA: 50S ribosomal protein L9 [Rubricoccaceae bacterium]|jgi:large subunit ribosomal protein L9